jgi:hypothetical protein
MEELVAAGKARRVAVRSDGGRWWRVDVEVDGGDDAAREMLATLIAAGMPIARFERVVAPLAEIIERAIGRSGRR